MEKKASLWGDGGEERLGWRGTTEELVRLNQAAGLFHWVSLNCKHGSVKGEDVVVVGEKVFS